MPETQTLTNMVETSFWNGTPTRAEVQNAFNEQARALHSMGAALSNLDMAMLFIFEQLGVKPDELKAFAEKKAAEFKAQKEAAEEQKS